MKQIYHWRGLDDPLRSEIVEVEINADSLLATGKQMCSTYTAHWGLKVRSAWITESVVIYISGLCQRDAISVQIGDKQIGDIAFTEENISQFSFDHMSEHYCRYLRLTRDAVGNWTDKWQINCVSNLPDPGIVDYVPELWEGKLIMGLDVFNCDIANSPLTNLMPIRKLGVLDRSVSAGYSPVAWIDLPSLQVQRIDQWYESDKISSKSMPTTAPMMHQVRYRSASGFTAELSVDELGIVHDYPEVAYLETIFSHR